MRTYGRIKNLDGSRSWVEVETDAQGFDDRVYLTTLCQVLQLSPNESPFFSNYGIPAHQMVVQQVYPDFYVALTQQQFSGFFAALTVAAVRDRDPHYKINVTTQSGFVLDVSVPIAT